MAVEEVADAEFFHSTNNWPYGKFPPLNVGVQIQVGDAYNPFFGYYETPRTYQITGPAGNAEMVLAMQWLKRVKSGNIVPNNLPHTSHDIAEHFQLLARELVMEETRLRIQPKAPSRQTCLWLAESSQLAWRWRNTIGWGQVVKILVTGTIFRVDASLLSGDAEAYSAMVDKAERYWSGEITPNPHPEVLFSGVATVAEFLPQGS